MKKRIKKIVVGLIHACLAFNVTTWLFNMLFEYGNFHFKDFVKRNIGSPVRSISWKIDLLSGKWIKINIEKNNFLHWDFALSYLYHDIGLSYLEYFLGCYYDNKFTYIDIGGNMGLRSLCIASMGRNTVIFEPNTDLHTFLVDNFKRNNIDNVHLENKCVSNVNGEVEFYFSKSTYQSSINYKIAETNGITRMEKVQTVKLDDYLNAYRNIIPGIVKIDVEGHEFEVLKGATETIEQHHPTFIIEVLGNWDVDQHVFAFMFDRGYECFGIHQHKKRMLFLPQDNSFTTTNYLFIENSNRSLYGFLLKHNLFINA